MKSFALISCLLFSLGFLPTYAQDTALLEAEQARGLLTGENGVQWTVSVTGANNARFIATSHHLGFVADVVTPNSLHALPLLLLSVRSGLGNRNWRLRISQGPVAGSA
ncbi:MAG: hypothetical protein CMO47_07585, partial [Verrucomicrobiales bacterium]|nr:hypothetical protein [Verrucomicrobiales bacterium]